MTLGLLHDLTRLACYCVCSLSLEVAHTLLGVSIIQLKFYSPQLTVVTRLGRLLPL